MNDLDCPSDLLGMDNIRLLAEFRLAFRQTIEHITRLAWIVRILEDRGEDLTELRVTLLPYLRQVAHGRLAAEAVVRYAESPVLMRAIAGLPVTDQRRLASGEPVAMAVCRPDGTVDHRMVDPLHLQGRQIGQIFARDHIRSVGEQAVILSAPPRPRKTARTTPVGGVRLDRERGGLVVGRTFVPTSSVVAALAALRGDEDNHQPEDTGERKPVVIHLTEAEFNRLRTVAFEGRVKHAPLVKRAMRAYGLI